MISGQGTTIQGCTLEQGKCFVTTGDFPGANVVECVEDGTITVTWKDDTTEILTMTSGWVNPINCKSVAITTGTWNVSRV